MIVQIAFRRIPHRCGKSSSADEGLPFALNDRCRSLPTAGLKPSR
jgi:hypothetical protein